MYNYNIIDAHCDTISQMYIKTALKKSKGHLDIERMKMYRGWIQIFALWSENEGEAKQKQSHLKMLERFYDQIGKNADDIVFADSAGKIKSAFEENRTAAVLAVEGADWIESADDIMFLYQKGVRCITLTWNGSNYIGGGVGDKKEKGLTEFGKKAVRLMNDIGILTDVSHASEKTFWDTIETSTKPISATHSNSKAICPHRRNLTDEQFLALIKTGGVCGINYYPVFVSDKKSAKIDDIIRHIEHFCALGGEDNIGLGGDFDGIDITPDDLRGAEDVHILLDRLLKMNYSEDTVKKIAGKNFCRLLCDVIKP